MSVEENRATAGITNAIFIVNYTETMKFLTGQWLEAGRSS